MEVSQDPADDTPAILTKYQKYFGLPWPLLTGTQTNVDQFWSQLKVPPIQKRSLGRTGADRHVHRSARALQPCPRIRGGCGQPEWLCGCRTGEPADAERHLDSPTISRYLDAQGRQELKVGGSWTPQSLLADITPVLEQQGTYTTLPQGTGRSRSATRRPTSLSRAPRAATSPSPRSWATQS